MRYFTLAAAYLSRPVSISAKKKSTHFSPVFLSFSLSLTLSWKSSFVVRFLSKKLKIHWCRQSICAYALSMWTNYARLMIIEIDVLLHNKRFLPFVSCVCVYQWGLGMNIQPNDKTKRHHHHQHNKNNTSNRHGVYVIKCQCTADIVAAAASSNTSIPPMELVALTTNRFFCLLSIHLRALFSLSHWLKYYGLKHNAHTRISIQFSFAARIFIFPKRKLDPHLFGGMIISEGKPQN